MTEQKITIAQLRKAAQQFEGEKVVGYPDLTITTEEEKSCWTCTNKAVKIILGQVWMCLKGPNCGEFIPMENSLFYICPVWEEIVKNENN